MIYDWVLIKMLEFAAGKGVDKGLEQLVHNKATLRRYLSSQSLERSIRTRVSASELISIRNSHGDYLLINNRRRSQFGPIGGVIQFHPSGFSDVVKKFGYEPQETGSLDMRGFILGRHFPAFLRWFYIERGREKCCLARELREELVEMNFNAIAEKVINPEFEALRVIHEGPTKVQGEQYQQYRVILIKRFADCISSDELAKLIIATAETAILKCQSEASPPEQWPFVFASESEIRKGRSKKLGQRIGDHAGYLFSEERLGVEPPSFLGLD